MRKEWDLKHPEKMAEYRRKWRANNAEKEKSYFKTPVGRLRANLRNRLNIALARNYKKGSAIADLGMSVEQFWDYLESKFQPGMTRENYGRKPGCWSIDHIKPLASFDLTDAAQLREAVHYSNMQPLWHTANLKKWAKS
jgi:hypothetical protein